MSFPEALDPRRLSLPRRIRIPRVSVPRTLPRPKRPRVFLAVTLLAIFLVSVCAWMLVRNSSLVEVREVKIVGLSGYYDKHARAAVLDEATKMTTMNFDASRIESAAGQFVDVSGVKVETDFPHAATIYVSVRRPVVLARLNGSTVVLSQDGEVMSLSKAVAGLPHIQASATIEGGRVTGGKALEAAKLLGAAPDTLLRKVDSIHWGKLGVVVSLDNGPDLYFGGPDNAAAKWRDAATVLASTQAKGAAYLDLRVPGRPAIGGLGGAPAATATTQTTTTADGTEIPVPAADASTPPDAGADQTSTPQQTEQTAPQQQTEAPAQAQPQQNQAPPAGGGAGL